MSSIGYKGARKLDYEMLSTVKPGDGKGIADAPEALRRYSDSKLANLYFALELDRRLRARGVDYVFCNVCHPGVAGGTGLGNGGLGRLGDYLEPAIRGFVKLIGNSNVDSAKTSVYLAAAREVKERKIHGQYWEPTWNWTSKYVACKEKLPLTELGSDQEEQSKLWDFSLKAIQKAGVTL